MALMAHVAAEIARSCVGHYAGVYIEPTIRATYAVIWRYALMRHELQRSPANHIFM